MDTLKVTPIVETSAYAAVYHSWSDEDQSFHVHLATSTDLLAWTWQTELGVKASQPTIAAASDGGYVVAWEQEPDPIHIVIALYPTWNDLLGAAPRRRFDVPVTMPACGEGTPSIQPRAANALSSASITTPPASGTSRRQARPTGRHGRLGRNGDEIAP